MGVSSTSKNRPSHHKYKYESPKQFELKQLKGSKAGIADASIKKNKNQSEIAAACEQKTTSEKANFCSNTVFSF